MTMLAGNDDSDDACCLFTVVLCGAGAGANGAGATILIGIFAALELRLTGVIFLVPVRHYINYRGPGAGWRILYLALPA